MHSDIMWMTFSILACESKAHTSMPTHYSTLSFMQQEAKPSTITVDAKLHIEQDACGFVYMNGGHIYMPCTGNLYMHTCTVQGNIISTGLHVHVVSMLYSTCGLIVFLFCTGCSPGSCGGGGGVPQTETESHHAQLL